MVRGQTVSSDAVVASGKVWSGSRGGRDIVPIKSSQNSTAISSSFVPSKFQLLVVIESVTKVEAQFEGFPHYFLSLGHYLATEDRFIMDIFYHIEVTAN